ncbi:MAG: hypothetical protein R2932_04210 [Caldilineaceae bacterium]
MKIQKAVITAAGRKQRTLPLQTVTDRDGVEKSVLSVLVEEVLRAGIEEICVVVRPGDEQPYADVTGEHAGRLHFVPQSEPLGHGHAVYCSRSFVGHEAFLHLVGDHLYVSRGSRAVHNGWSKSPRSKPVPSRQCRPHVKPFALLRHRRWTPHRRQAGSLPD